MANFMCVVVVGHLTRDPELKYLADNTAICNCGIAYTKSWRDKQTGKKGEKTAFIDIKLWGGLGERFAEWFRKGQSALVFGKLEQEEWTDKQSGSKRSKLVLKVDEYENLSPKPRDSDSGQREMAEASVGDDDVPF